jgi:hypothetical protein
MSIDIKSKISEFLYRPIYYNLPIERGLLMYLEDKKSLCHVALVGVGYQCLSFISDVSDVVDVAGMANFKGL